MDLPMLTRREFLRIGGASLLGMTSIGRLGCGRYLAFNAVHGPMASAAEYLQRVSGIQDPKRRLYAAMTVAMDDAVGRVLATLRKEGLEQDTFFSFSVTTGGRRDVRPHETFPFEASKGRYGRVVFVCRFWSNGKVFFPPEDGSTRRSAPWISCPRFWCCGRAQAGGRPTGRD
jgi:hypothetical protein